MDDDKIEQMRYFCQWRKTKKKKCLLPADIVYNDNCTYGVGMCQLHFESFCELQEKGKRNKARQKIGLKQIENQTKND